MNKMILKSLFYLMVFELIISCGSNKQRVVPENPHMMEHQKMHDESAQEKMNKEFLEKITGTYVGKIPCAGCEAILYTLELNTDNTYKTTLTYVGKSNTPILNEGSFS